MKESKIRAFFIMCIILFMLLILLNMVFTIIKMFIDGTYSIF